MINFNFQSAALYGYGAPSGILEVIFSDWIDRIFTRTWPPTGHSKSLHVQHSISKMKELILMRKLITTLPLQFYRWTWFLNSILILIIFLEEQHWLLGGLNLQILISAPLLACLPLTCDDMVFCHASWSVSFIVNMMTISLFGIVRYLSFLDNSWRQWITFIYIT